MKTTELYGQRGQSKENTNFEVVTDCFWAMCRDDGATEDSEVQESYILSRLVPSARSQGSRRIFADAHLWSSTKAGRAEKDKSRQVLQELIQASRHKTITIPEFRQKSGDVLGPPPLEPDAKVAYKEFVPDFLGRACSALVRDEAQGLKQALAEWDGVMKSIGCRGGREIQKMVLDVLSYECRAALHRCCSAAWCLLLPHLAQKYKISTETASFLRSWHLDQVSEAAEGDFAYFHLFHGHVFALHPASGALLQTTAGRELVGEWLQDPKNPETFGRLLHGILVAVHHYAERRETTALERPGP